MNFRRAETTEAGTLSDLAFRAKSHWGYASVDLQRWKDDMTLTAASIEQQPTFVVEEGAEILGVVQLWIAAEPWKIEALWIDPQATRRGYGSGLLRHAAQHARAAGQDHLSIDADPNAEAFYLAFGARRVGEINAPVQGDPARVRPQLVWSIRAS